MDDDPLPERHTKQLERINVSISTIFQSPRIQRGIRKYNECHTLLLAYCLYYVLYSRYIILYLFSNEVAGQQKEKDISR